MDKILITGGTGQVGRELRKLFSEAQFFGSKECNLKNKNEIESMFKANNPTIVLHTAAYVGGITDNINNQVKYYVENVLIDTNLIQTCLDFGVKKFIAILSTCAYPDTANNYPLVESDLHFGVPSASNFGYAIAKRGMATYIDSIRSESKLDYCYLIPPNLYGVYDKFNDRSHFIAALLMKISEASLLGKKEIKLFGSGKALRQVLHARDLARVMAAMVENDIYQNLNVANEDNISVETYARLILDTLGFTDWKISFDQLMPDGQYRKDVSIDKFKSYFPNFKFTKFEDGIKEVYQNIFQ
jgi:GDP-L-fucose synthase